MRAYFTRRSKMPLARGSFCGNANKGGGKRAFCCLQKLPLQLPFGRRRVNMGAAPGSSIHGSFLWAVLARGCVSRTANVTSTAGAP